MQCLKETPLDIHLVQFLLTDNVSATRLYNANQMAPCQPEPEEGTTYYYPY